MPQPVAPEAGSLEFENTPVKLVSLRKIPRTETPGLTLEEVEERREFNAPYWVSRILTDAGYAKMTEDGLTSEEWTQVHFKERFNPGGPPGPLPKDFYRRAYVSFLQAQKEAGGDAAKIEQLNRIQARFRDVLEGRIGKITRLAAADSLPPQGVLQPEEQRLYDELQALISDWRGGMRRLGVN